MLRGGGEVWRRRSAEGIKFVRDITKRKRVQGVEEEKVFIRYRWNLEAEAKSSP